MKHKRLFGISVLWNFQQWCRRYADHGYDGANNSHNVLLSCCYNPLHLYRSPLTTTRTAGFNKGDCISNGYIKIEIVTEPDDDDDDDDTVTKTIEITYGTEDEHSPKEWVLSSLELPLPEERRRTQSGLSQGRGWLHNRTHQGLLQKFLSRFLNTEMRLWYVIHNNINKKKVY